MTSGRFLKGAHRGPMIPSSVSDSLQATRQLAQRSRHWIVGVPFYFSDHVKFLVERFDDSALTLRAFGTPMYPFIV